MQKLSNAVNAGIRCVVELAMRSGNFAMAAV